ncbi:MAG TPA: SpoIID/LytB domain-containing protein [Actinomycetota bacterium]
MRRFLWTLALSAALLPAPAASAKTIDRITFRGTSEAVFTVEGRYPVNEDACPRFRHRSPLRAKYRGSIQLRLEDDGSISIVNTLSFADYLAGIAEVPLTWPVAALRAQVIAARSYALHAYRQSGGGSYDICATDRCQVYRGATIELGPFGDRWTAAVRGTSGQVLTRNGSVVQAFYFSTSDGHTRRAFQGGTPQPYLRRASGEDGDTPLGHWTARFPRRDFEAILRRAGLWPGGRVERVGDDGDVVVVRGTRTRRRVDKSTLTAAFNTSAPCFSRRYPSQNGSQEGTPLPQTVPSTSFTAVTAGNRIELRGRGWGHFVGMSQWGAKRLADRGRSTRAILRHYYRASIDRVREPASLRVLAAESLRSVRIGIEGDATIRTGTGGTLGPGDAFEVTGGKGLTIERGRGPDTRAVLSVEPRTSAITTAAGTPAVVRFRLSDDARVTIRVSGETPLPAPVEDASFEGGIVRLRVPLAAGDGTDLGPGSYRLVIEASDGFDFVRSRPIALTVTGGGGPLPGDAGTVPFWLVAAGLAALVLAMIWFGAQMITKLLIRR